MKVTKSIQLIVDGEDLGEYVTIRNESPIRRLETDGRTFPPLFVRTAPIVTAVGTLGSRTFGEADVDLTIGAKAGVCRVTIRIPFMEGDS